MLGKYFSLGPLDSRLDEWLSENLGHEFFSPKEGRLEKYFSSFKKTFQEKDIPIITIAGTNGKGEVALLLESLFIDSGWSPLLWSSPHTLSVRERFSCSGYPIEAAELLELFKEHHYLCEELSYYEFLYYCFNKWVASKINDVQNPVLILEVGLGGRLDATNFFDTHLALLVSIGRDHMEFLGPTLKDVLKEKVEIVRAKRPCVSAVSQPHLNELLKTICRKKEVELICLSNEGYADKKSGTTVETFRSRNRRMAKRAFEVFFEKVRPKVSLPKTPDLPEVTWARPFKVTYKTTQFILVGSHNLDGLRQLATWVNDENNRLGLNCSFYSEVWVGMSRKVGKDLDQCLRLIHDSPCLGQEVVLFNFDHPRATPLEDMKASWPRENQGRKVRFEKSWQQYIDQDHSHKNILVCGSYYFVGELLRKSSLKSHLNFH